MDWKALICGAFSGIFLIAGVSLFIPSSRACRDERAIQLSRRFSKSFEKRYQVMPDFNPAKSFLAQRGTNMEFLMEIYMNLSSVELKDEINKIDREREGDASSSVSDAIAIMFLAYRWGQLDKEEAFDYSESRTLTLNRSIEEPYWSHLLIHSWANRNPEAAYKYLVERKENSIRRKTERADVTSSAENGNTIMEKIEEADDDCFYDEVLKTIAFSMGKTAPDISLHWAEEAGKKIKFFGVETLSSLEIKEWVLKSVARNHPERIPVLFTKLCGGNEMEEWPAWLPVLYFSWRNIDKKAADLWLDSLEIKNASDSIKRYVLKEEVLNTFEGAVDQKKMGSTDLFSDDYNPDIILDTRDILEKFATREPGKTFNFIESVYGKDKDSFYITVARYLTPRTRAEAFRMLKDLKKQELSDNCSLWGSELWNRGRYLGYKFKDIATLSRICSQRTSFDFNSVKGAIESWNCSSENIQEMEKWIQSSELTEKDRNKCQELLNRLKAGNHEKSDPFL